MNTNKTQHFRALAICLFLLVAPSVLIVTLWKYFQVGTWILAVSAFCVEVIVKVLVTVTIYTLFMWDSHCEDGLWESLDDWVYYIRGVGNTVEFFFAIFLFFNGGWILIFESGGTIRACMMLIHAYFNIWCEARNGWSAFIKRRTAVGKINSLADASQQEIQRHNDVCAICYQEMSVAKVTRCKHMFHSICLRKWLYMQDNCPMCHEKLYLSTKQTEANGEQEEELVDTEDDNESDVTVDFTDSDEEEPIGAVEDLKAEVNALLSTPAQQDAEDEKVIEEAKQQIIDESEAKEAEDEGAVINIQVIEEKKDEADVLDIVKAAEEAFVAEVIPDNAEVDITPEEGEEVIEYTLNTAA